MVFSTTHASYGKPPITTGRGYSYDTASGNLVAASFSILNASIAAGGGYVDGSTVLLPSKAILGTSSTTPTYNNATLTDKNTIAETNNDRLKTPSTAGNEVIGLSGDGHCEYRIVLRVAGQVYLRQFGQHRGVVRGH